MYEVLIDDKVLYTHLIADLKIFNPKVQLEVNTTGRFTFTMYPGHPRYNEVKAFKSVIEIFQNGVRIFRGRPLDVDGDFENSKTVYCEGDLAFLMDSIQRPYQWSGGVVDYLQFLIDRHNDQVEESKRFIIGNVTVTDPNDYIVRADSQYLRTWEIIDSKLIKMMGGYLVVRHVEGTNYIDYLDDSTYRSDQVIKLGENMLDLAQSRKGSAICTALIPTGATLETENETTGETTDSVVDIRSVNDGLDYIYNQEAVDRFGWIFKHVEFENITEPLNLKIRAERELGDLISYTTSIEIKVIDLNLVDADVHRLRFFEYVKVESLPHGVDDFYLIEKQFINLTNPQENTITIGRESRTITNNTVVIRDELNVIRDKNVANTNKITETYNNLTLSIIESAERYYRELKQETSDELDQLRSEVSTQFEQTNQDFLFQFTTLIEQLTELDDETRSHFEQMIKYIRFIDGNIVLGVVGNDLILNISNDRISFLQNNTEVAYFSNNQMFVKDGTFLNTLRLGNFAFIPRDNGNLSFRKEYDT